MEKEKKDLKEVEKEQVVEANLEELSEDELEEVSAGATSPYVKKKVVSEILKRF